MQWLCKINQLLFGSGMRYFHHILLLICILLIASCAKEDPEELLIAGRIISQTKSKKPCAGFDMILVKSSNKIVIAVTVSNNYGEFGFKRRDLINVSKQVKYDLICYGYNDMDSLMVMHNIDGAGILDAQNMLDILIEVPVNVDSLKSHHK